VLNLTIFCPFISTRWRRCTSANRNLLSYCKLHWKLRYSYAAAQRPDFHQCGKHSGNYCNGKMLSIKCFLEMI